MANGNGNGKGPSWRWLSCLVIGILIAIGGYFMSEARSDIKTLQQNKVDKADYEKDLQRFEAKLDRIINMHMRDR